MFYLSLSKKKSALESEIVAPVPVESGLGQVLNYDGTFNIIDKVNLK